MANHTTGKMLYDLIHHIIFFAYTVSILYYILLLLHVLHNRNTLTRESKWDKPKDFDAQRAADAEAQETELGAK